MIWYPAVIEWVSVDPLDLPTIAGGSDHYFHTCGPPVTTFQNLAKKQLSSENSGR